uniref:Calreticulin n=1 Tax=Romanomermis culicivorax TaxID=13658 RepID=A0A915KQF0_ROMCU
MLKLCAILAAFLSIAFAEIYLDEKFDDGDAWENRWKQSTHKSDYGKFKLTAGKFYGDSEADKGIQTSQDARFYELTRKMDKTFTNDKKPLVVQFTVKHEQSIDCGGGYIKVLPASSELSDFNGETPYQIMFGPDICGYSTKKVHVILNHNGKNHNNKKEIKCKDDEFTHLYTLIIRPDHTYEVLIDNEKVESGDLETDWDILPPKKIKDPNAKKPEDWDDKEYIDDTDDKKPEDWDQPENIPDPDAKKPEDWDDEMDGEWEPPKITNPKFKGEWKPRQIKNPNYKGEWVHPEIDNPEYKDEPNLHMFKDMAAVGFDLWQVKSGTIFDNILITDDVDYAKQHGKDTWGKTKEPEKAMKDKIDEENRKKEEEEEKKRKEKEDSEKKDDKEDKEDEDDDDEEKEKKDEKDTKEKDEL